MKEKLIILTIVIYLFNLFFVHGQTMVGNFDPHEYYAMIDTLPRPYESIPQYRLKADNVGEWLYEREELNKPPIDAYQPLQIEMVPTFGGNSVTKTLEYESGILAEFKIAIHNQSDVVNKSFPYYTSVSIGLSNLSLPDESGRKTYDYLSYGLELGTWYEQFLIYGFINWNSNKERAYGTYGIGGGVKLPVSDKFSVNVMGELGKIAFNSPFLIKDNKEYYQSLSIGIGYKIY